MGRVGAATRGLATALAATTGQDTPRYLHRPLGLQSQHQPDDSWAFPLMDGLGSVRGVVNEDLSHLESRQYAPYGEEYDTTGSEQTAFGFTGEPVDANGLVHLRARYYDPAMGRFMQMDPSRREQNLYQYALSNPVVFIDPSGLTYCVVPELCEDTEDPLTPQLLYALQYVTQY